MGNSRLRQVLMGASVASVLFSLVLYARDRREDAIFVGLWAPTVISMAESLVAEVEG